MSQERARLWQPVVPNTSLTLLPRSKNNSHWSSDRSRESGDECGNTICGCENVISPTHVE
jgi:hypothetical protein